MGKSRNAEFLRKIDDRGYPVDYLLARIRGRRSHLIKDWRPLILGSVSPGHMASARYGSIISDDYPEAIQEHLLKEFGWVYSLMNGALRQVFSPFFLYVELRTIFICLRYAKGKEAGKIERILSGSLLSEKIKDVLRCGENLLSAVEGLEDCFTSLSNRFAGLGNVFAESGLPGFESALSIRYLEYAMHSKLHPVMQDFFRAVVDSRNILALYKYIRLCVKMSPPFISGGSISEATHNEIAAGKDLAEISSLVRKLGGIEPELANMETSLYKMVTRLLKKAGRDPLSVGLILDYLWRCSIEATNISILLYGRDIEREIIEAEMVQ
ncbi:MAG: V-type ATPase subunit [Nitrospirae bacterium]|nr:V-type ATPase subunit [Nitrospirota bacterium]